MEIIIWGTGGYASGFMEKYKSQIEKFAHILGVVDDCDARAGSYFYGYKILSLKELEKLDFDFIIQFERYNNCSFEESKFFLPEKFRDKLLHRDSYIGHLLDKSCYLENRSVLFIGDETGYEYYGYAKSLLLKDSGFISVKDLDTVNINNYDLIFIVPPWFIGEKKSAEYERKVISIIKSFDNALISKIVPFFFWREMMTLADRNIGKGEKNPDKKFFVIMQNTGAGWATILLHFYKAMAFAKKNDMIPVIDMQNFKTQYISEDRLGKENVWTDFFESVSDYSLEEVYNSKNVVLCARDSHWAEPIDRDCICLNEKTREYIENKKKEIFPAAHKKVLGVLYRGTDFNSASGHPNHTDLDSIVIKIRSFMNDHTDYDTIFLATEVEEAVEFLKKEFGDSICCVDQKRYAASERRILSSIKFERENDEYKRAIEYLSVIYILISCDSMIGVNCGGTLLARKLKEYEHIEIFDKYSIPRDKGKYERYLRFIKRKFGIFEYSPSYKRKSNKNGGF